MPSVRHNHNRHQVIEFVRDERTVWYIRNVDGQVDLHKDSIDEFSREFNGYTEDAGGMPYDPREAARMFLDYPYTTLSSSATTALAQVLSVTSDVEAPWSLVDVETMRVIGHFELYVDLKRITKLLPFPTFTLEKWQDLEELDGAKLLQLQNGLDPSNPLGILPKGNKRKTFLKELYDMTKTAEATAPAKKTAATGDKTPRVPKTDGPVFKAKALYDKMEADLRAGKKSRKDALDAAVASGINVATATTQYGLWAKTKNIQTVRAKPVAKEKPVETAAAKSAPATKKAPTKTVKK